MQIANVGLLAAVAIMPVVPALSNAPAMAGQPALVIAAPWGDSAQISMQVGGQPVMAAALPLGTEAIFDDHQLTRLRARSDVWLVLDAAKLADICGFS